MSLHKVIRVGFALAVKDVSKLTDFYTEKFGFTLEASFTQPDYVILERNSVRLSLAEAGHPSADLPSHVMTAPTEPSRPSTMLILEVGDCDGARMELEAAGVTFVSATYRPPWGGARCFVTDPEGTLIELEELP